MGGDSTHDGSMDHRPYTSVRKLFYNFPNVCELDRTRKGCSKIPKEMRRASCQPRIVERDVYYDHNNTNMEQKRTQHIGRRSTGNIRTHLSVNFLSRLSGSYSDLHCAPLQVENNLLKCKITQSELNLKESRIDEWEIKKAQSFNPAKFQRDDCVFRSMYDLSERKQYEIYDDTECCLKPPVGVYCSDEEEKSQTNCKFITKIFLLFIVVIFMTVVNVRNSRVSMISIMGGFTAKDACISCFFEPALVTCYLD